ncbi:MAG: hypothetical protein L0099_08495 [Acidobacteria bacterium]|nr:hypothetical protein [Acidobacteriota bacterium]
MDPEHGGHWVGTNTEDSERGKYEALARYPRAKKIVHGLWVHPVRSAQVQQLMAAYRWR